MRPVSCPETLVRNCQFSLRNNPEKRSSLGLIVLFSFSEEGGPTGYKKLF